MNIHQPPENAQTRFSNRVADYVRYRPGYPNEVVLLLQKLGGLKPGARVADIGSGTGIFSKLLLEAGAEVFAVEPNGEMRTAAEELLGDHPGFHSIAAPGEDTSLPDHSIDIIVSAQAFHWLDREQARREFTRIIKPGGCIALIWNVRQTGSTAFLQSYEALLREFAPDYAQVRHENVDTTILKEFFDGKYQRHTFANAQHFDFEGLRGRLLSSSYAPASGHPLHEPMLRELQRLFDEHQQDNLVTLLYDTEVYLG